MTPVRITAAVAEPVSLAEIKAYCAVDHDDDDAMLAGLITAAVAHLDGYSGVLGRAIMEQVWQIAPPAAGDYLLPMPDVIAAAATYDGDPSPVALEIEASPVGPIVTVDAACTVWFSCGMEADKHAIAALIVKMMVAHWYDRRGAVMSSAEKVPMAAEMLITSLRWRHF